MGTAWLDAVFAARLLRKSPAFTVAAVLTLALGVGVNTAVFSVVNAVVLRPLPVRDGDRLAAIARHSASSSQLLGVSAPDLADHRDLTSTVFDDLAGYDIGFTMFAMPGARAERVIVTWVTGNYFSLLDLQPALGRLIGRDEVVAGRSDPVVVLGYSAWERRFARDPSVVGRAVLINGRQLTIVGIAPRNFAGTFAFTDSELYLPLTWSEGLQRLRTGHTIGRLLPGVTIERAQAALTLVARRLAQDDPDKYAGVAFSVVPEQLARPEEDQARWNARSGAITLALVALVLSVAAVNVTNLLLARGVDRRRELAVRAALGAGRSRLIRQLLTEGMLLAALGGAAGVVLARWTVSALSRFQLPGDKPLHLDFHVDTRVLAYAIAAAAVTGLVVGLAPAFQSTRVDLDEALRDGGRRSAAGGGRRRIRHVLIVGQIAACFMLLFAAGLFTRSLTKAEHVDLGFRPAGVLNVGMSVEPLGFSAARGRELFELVERRVRALPGVDNVSFAANVPLGYVRLRASIDAEGRAIAAGDRLVAGFNNVSPEYFSAMGIPIVAGRGFTRSDDDRVPGVAIVNQRFAEAVWPSQSPIGRRFRTTGPGEPWLEVIGVTPTGRYEFFFEEPQPFFYAPLAQQDSSLRTLQIRTALAPESLVPAVSRAIADVEPQLPLFDVMSMERLLDSGPSGFLLVRWAAVFAGILGLLALSLAVIGLYGVVSHSVSQRTHEIGVRMALGAAPGDVARLVVGDGLMVIVAGIGAGLAAALAASRFVASLLFDVSARDPLTLAVVAPILSAVALVACAIPAWRAMRVDPAHALRED